MILRYSASVYGECFGSISCVRSTNSPAHPCCVCVCVCVCVRACVDLVSESSHEGQATAPGDVVAVRPSHLRVPAQRRRCRVAAATLPRRHVVLHHGAASSSTTTSSSSSRCAGGRRRWRPGQLLRVQPRPTASRRSLQLSAKRRTLCQVFHAQHRRRRQTSPAARAFYIAAHARASVSRDARCPRTVRMR